jgi:uncharacterized protein
VRVEKKWGLFVGLLMLFSGLLVWLFVSAGRGDASNGDGYQLRADGIARAEVRLAPSSGSGQLSYSLKTAPGVARLLQVRYEAKADVVVVQAGVVAGDVWVIATLPAKQVADPGEGTDADGPEDRSIVAELTVTPYWRDSRGDGFPDSLTLHSAGDTRAFLDWFRYLAEEQYYRGDELSPEINDCAALLRYAYREALRQHDGEWATRNGLRAVQPIPDVNKYQYPFTPLRADLFRLRPGSFELSDLTSGAFGQFADAEHLLLYNTTSIGKDIGQMQPGDLLFYRQEDQNMPFHAMLFLGGSMLDPSDREHYLLYHTGPDGTWPGEMRRRTITEMMQHPEARWHPVPMNPAFLGVYRWKIVSNGNGT